MTGFCAVVFHTWGDGANPLILQRTLRMLLGHSGNILNGGGKEAPPAHRARPSWVHFNSERGEEVTTIDVNLDIQTVESGAIGVEVEADFGAGALCFRLRFGTVRVDVQHRRQIAAETNAVREGSHQRFEIAHGFAVGV